MNRFLMQFSAVFVTALVVFGTDSDVLRAAPLGLFAGTFASFLVFVTDFGVARARSPLPTLSPRMRGSRGG